MKRPNTLRQLNQFFVMVVLFSMIFKVANSQENDSLSVIYLDAIANQMYSEADQIAKQRIEQAIRDYGLNSHESANAMIDLAIAQLGLEDFESSITNYETAINIIERVENQLDKRLINPLRGLAEAQLKNYGKDFEVVCKIKCLAELICNHCRRLHSSDVIFMLLNCRSLNLLSCTSCPLVRLHEIKRKISVHILQKVMFQC